jgi:D-alanyl-D-alanine carboxypeptidase
VGLFVIAAWLGVPAAHADPTDDFVRAQMKRQNIPGLAVAVIKDGTVVKAEGYGVADIRTKTAATPETVFKIASVSKQFVAAGIMLLVQDGRITVDDPVTRHVSDAPTSWSGISIRHLLTHTSGLVREPPAFDPTRQQSLTELIRSAYGQPLLFAPGEQWGYSNLGYNLLAEIIGRASGIPWTQFIADRIFKPAGMLATRTTTTEPVPDRARGYTDNDRLADAPDWPAVRPGGAFISTVLDLAKWDAMLYTNAMLTEETRRQMWTPVVLNDGTTYPYGFGWHLNRPGTRPQVYHGGGLPGFIAQYRRYIDDRVTIVVLMNLDDADDETIAFGVAELHLPDR